MCSTVFLTTSDKPILSKNFTTGTNPDWDVSLSFVPSIITFKGDLRAFDGLFLFIKNVNPPFSIYFIELFEDDTFPNYFYTSIAGFRL
jgi:hypothetical protein